ncbi:MAG: S8 family serine peptidase [Thermoleophilaceae bacterium]|nr:S8 family serine peptidase [Thermoleophilaceae bacterium]
MFHTPIVRPRLTLLLLLAMAAPAGAAEPTGRHLAVFTDSSGKSASASAVQGVLARAGVKRVGPGAPRLGVVTVDGPRAALRVLERDRRVRSVEPEWQRDLRRVPNDPSLATQEGAAGTPPGVVQQWFLARSNFPAAWEVTTGARSMVGVIDSGIDGGHAELGPKAGPSLELGSTSGALSDADGHGSHVAGLACASANDGRGVAGAGWDCRLGVVKAPRLRDEDVVRGIQFLTDNGAGAINMSFGGGPPSSALSEAIDYGVARGVVLVAAASNSAVTDQGAPASQLQPNDAPDLNAGRGLVVTGVDINDTNPQTGAGPQISLASYGFFGSGSAGPPGLLSTYPGASTARDLEGCACRQSLEGDNRFAYLEGTSMSAPLVSATAAMLAEVNPGISAAEKIRVIKESARRPAGAWTPELGWGILDAGAAVEAARRIDRTAPQSSARSKRSLRLRRDRKGRTRKRRVRVAWSGSDPPGGPVLVPSGVASVELYERFKRGKYRRVGGARGANGSAVRTLRRAGIYSYVTVAVDAAGNREAPATTPDSTLRLKRAAKPRRRAR